MSMPWDEKSRLPIGAARIARPLSAALGLLAATLPAIAIGTPAAETPACTAELAAMDSSFTQGLVRVLTAATPAEQCAALANQLQAIAIARDVQARCRATGSELDGVLAMLDASALDFQRAQMSLGCNVPA
jgi:hypothetical protein